MMQCQGSNIDEHQVASARMFTNVLQILQVLQEELYSLFPDVYPITSLIYLIILVLGKPNKEVKCTTQGKLYFKAIKIINEHLIAALILTFDYCCNTFDSIFQHFRMKGKQRQCTHTIHFAQTGFTIVQCHSSTVFQKKKERNFNTLLNQ